MDNGSASVNNVKQIKEDKKTASTFEFSINRLQEAVIWTEILGKPISKRRKRR
jgi:hypothetical protein